MRCNYRKDEATAHLKTTMAVPKEGQCVVDSYVNTGGYFFSLNKKEQWTTVKGMIRSMSRFRTVVCVTLHSVLHPSWHPCFSKGRCDTSSVQLRCLYITGTLKPRKYLLRLAAALRARTKCCSLMGSVWMDGVEGYSLQFKFQPSFKILPWTTSSAVVLQTKPPLCQMILRENKGDTLTFVAQILQF